MCGLAHFFESQGGSFYRSNDGYGNNAETFWSPLMTLPVSQGKALSSFMMPMELWETSNDPNSEDTIRYELLPGLRSMGYGDGIKKSL